MKILVIPDIHQSIHWMKLFNGDYDLSKYDHIVQLGDWFDSFDKSSWKYGPIQNFEKIFEYKKTLPITILIGNHDMQYVGDETCSGFQAFRYREISDAIFKHVDEMDVAIELDGIVFSHAGFTKTWMKTYKLSSIDDVNELFHKYMDWRKVASVWPKQHPNFLPLSTIVYYKKFTDGVGYDEWVKPKLDEQWPIASKTLYDILKTKSVNKMWKTIEKFKAFNFHGWNCYGDDITQGPLWVRPNSLQLDYKYDYQCVGHTADKYGPWSYNGSCNIIYCDTYKNNMCVEIDTNKERGTFKTIEL